MAWFTREKHSDLQAGRMLARLTVGELATFCQFSEALINAVERGEGAAASNATVRRVLEACGIIFESPGVVCHLDGRLGLTRKAVGPLHGWRLRRARNALGLRPYQVASLAKVSDGTVKRLEAAGALNPTASVYAIVGALQLAGYAFGKVRKEKALRRAKQPQTNASEVDLPIEWLGVGLHVRGLDEDD